MCVSSIDMFHKFAWRSCVSPVLRCVWLLPHSESGKEVKETEVLVIYQPLPVTVYSVANCRYQGRKSYYETWLTSFIIYYVKYVSCRLFNHVFIVTHFPLLDFSRNLREIQEQADEYSGWNKHYLETGCLFNVYCVVVFGPWEGETVVGVSIKVQFDTTTAVSKKRSK